MRICVQTVLIGTLGWTLVLAPATLVSDGTIHDAFFMSTARLGDDHSVPHRTFPAPNARSLPGPPPIEVASLPLE